MRILAILLCGLPCVSADSKIAKEAVYVNGNIIAYDKGMTVEVACSKAGIELSQIVKDQVDDEQAIPFLVILSRKGTSTIYESKSDAEKLRVTEVLPRDTIALMNCRTVRLKIEDGMRRLRQMIESGSWGIRDQMLSIAELQRDYGPWIKICGEKDLEPVDSYLRSEVARLTIEGKGQRTINLLKSRLNKMQSDGIGVAHPNMKQIVELIDLFNEQRHEKSPVSKPEE